MSSAQTIACVACRSVSFVVELLELGVRVCPKVPSCECSEALDFVYRFLVFALDFVSRRECF